MIEVENLKKDYRTGTVSFSALRGVTFRIAAGDFVAIMGPSGSGKSTLMHILGALDTPTAGTYRFAGLDLATLDEDRLARIRREKIGFVFQAFNLLPRATVLRNVLLPLVYSTVAPASRPLRAAAALAAAGLTADLHPHRSNELSGGQIQRVAIARALVNDPDLILADEPTGNLDSHTSRIVLETFERLNRDQGRTIVLITHEREVAAHARRIIQLRDGLVVNDETT